MDSSSSHQDASSHQYHHHQQQQHSSNRVNNFKQKFIEKASGATAKAAEWRQKAAEKSTVLSAKAKNAVSDWEAKRSGGQGPPTSSTSGSSKHSGNSNNTSQNDPTILFGVDIAESTFKSHLPSNVPYDLSLYDSDTVYNVPAVCFRCVEYLDQTALDTVGIYRLSGSTTEIASLRRLFANVLSDAPPLNTLNPPPDPNAVASLFKAFLRELPTSLFPPLPSFPDSEVDPASLSEHLREYTKDEHISLLRLLFRHLQRVADLEENKMNAENLGIVFAPTLGVKAAVIKACVEAWNDAWPDPPSTSRHWELRESPEKEDVSFAPPVASTTTSTSAPRLNTTATPPIPPRSSVPPGSLSSSESSLQPQGGSQPPPPPKPARPRPKSSDASPSTSNSANLPATLQLLNLMDDDIPPTHSRSAGSGSGVPPALAYSSYNRPAKPPTHSIRTSGAASMATDLGFEDLHVMSPVDFTGSIYPSLPRDSSLPRERANGHANAGGHTHGARQNDMYGFGNSFGMTGGAGMYPSTQGIGNVDAGPTSSGNGNGNPHNPFAAAPPTIPPKEGNLPFLGTRGGYGQQLQQQQQQQQQPTQPSQVYQQPTQRYHAPGVSQPPQDGRHHVPPGYTYWSTPPPNAPSAAPGTSLSASSLASPYNPFDTQHQQPQQQVRHAQGGSTGKSRDSGKKPQPPERVDSFPNRI
ncbi:hypothetical protein HDU85_003577 [Gaertneriomyces sp. JEL0708]|nr:hypothetical protein HDU85_003577 [Gaertneriomyces sp. JEL0708]